MHILLLLLAEMSVASLSAAPFAATQPAAQITGDTTTLNGMATPNGFATTAWFEWGTNFIYGQVTSSMAVGSGNGVIRVGAGISNLVPGQTYHSRLVVSNAAGLAFGSDQSFTSSGKIVAWGDNSYGQKNVPPGLSNVVVIASGSQHCLALRTDGRVVAWGNNSFGQTNVPIGLGNVVAIAGGVSHCLALRNDGTVMAWGNNASGQTNVPVGLSNVVAIAGGSAHSLALRNDGTVVGWGTSLQANVPIGLSNVVAIAGGNFHSLALRNNGLVVAWGANTLFQTNVPVGLSNVVAVAGGSSSSLALRDNGTMVAWGAFSSVPAGVSNVVAIASGNDHNLALRSDGKVVAWGGANSSGQTTVPAGLSTVVALSAGAAYSLALAPNISPMATPQTVSGGANSDLVITLAGSDLNASDRLGFRIATLPGVGALYQYVGGLRGAAITSPNALVADTLGRVIFVPQHDGYGTPYSTFTFVANDGEADSPHATVTVRIFASPFAATQAATGITAVSATLNGMATANGYTAFAWFEWGTNGSYGQITSPMAVGNGANVVRVSAEVSNLVRGQAYHCRLVVSNAMGVAWGADQPFVTGGRVTAWADDFYGNYYGQATVPAGLSNAVAISCGMGHSSALLANGTIAAWGDNTYGQTIGAVGATNAILIAEGVRHGLALLSDRRVTAWGWNQSGQRNVPLSLTNVVALAGGFSHSLALRSDGTLLAWGGNSYNQTNVPIGLDNIVAIACGYYHSLALRNDGTVVGWGHYTAISGLSNVVAIAAGNDSSLAVLGDGTVVEWWLGSQVPTNIVAGVSNPIAITTGGSQTVALRSDGTLVAFGSRTNTPEGLTNVVAIARGDLHGLALAPNIAPQAITQAISGPANRDLVLTLHASDANGDRLTFMITSLPNRGNLYQCVGGLRGPIITAPGTLVSDAANRVVFVPELDGFGNPYTSSGFAAYDGLASSVPASVTISIGMRFAATQPATETTETGTTLNGMATPNGLPAFAWFEWGTNTSYGQESIPLAVGNRIGVVRVSAALTNLMPGQAYHSRLVVSNALGTVWGADQPLVTAGKVITWGFVFPNTRNVPLNMTNAVAVVGGADHRVALLSGGKVVAWGENDWGQTNVPPGLSNVVAIAAGYDHSLALRRDGTVVAWGLNNAGQSSVPSGLSNVIAVAGGGSQSLALLSDGTVVTWGGQWGTQRGLSNIVAIAAGGVPGVYYQNLALRNDGTVVAWIANLDVQASVPGGLSNIVGIATGESHSLALRSDGTVVVWGGQETPPPGLSNVVAIAGGSYHSLALRNDGVVVAWGDGSFGQTDVPENLGKAVAIAGADLDSLALVANKAPIADPQSVIGSVNSDLVIKLSGIDPDGGPIVKAFVVLFDGTIKQTWFYSSGTPSYRITTLPRAGTLYQFVSGVRGSAITDPSTPVTDLGGRIIFVPESGGYGNPYDNFTFVAADGQTVSVPAAVSIIIGIPFAATQRASSIGSASATVNGMVTANGLSSIAWFDWGTNSSFGNSTFPVVTGAGTAVVRLSAGLNNLLQGQVYHCRLVVSNAAGTTLGSDSSFVTGGKIAAWGYNNYTQTNVPARLSNVVGVGTGQWRSFAIRIDGSVAAWGDGFSGQTNVPSSLSNVVSVAGGEYHTLALRSNGTVVSWGIGRFGEERVPSGLTNIIAIAAGRNHSLALRSDGTMAAWGGNSSGEGSVPAGVSNIVAIASGTYHNLALKSDGTLLAWGYNYDGQINVPAGLNSVVGIGAGTSHSLALRGNGTIVVWGNNFYGQRNVPTYLTNAVSIAGGAAFSMALRSDGRVGGWGDDEDGRLPAPTWLSNVVALVCDAHTLALAPNISPTATPQTVSGGANSDLVITLAGSDLNASDRLGFRIATLPGVGALYQYVGGLRGAAITSPNALVADTLGRVIFVPQHDGYGTPYSTFTFVANDGEADSPHATVTVRIFASPFAATQAATGITAVSATLNGMATANGYTAFAWFEWGTNGSYGQITSPMAVGNGANVVRVSAEVSNLVRGQAYHCRLVVSNAMGVAWGADQPFVTGGRVTAWGDNSYGQNNPPIDLGDAVAISSGNYHSLALRTGGSVVAWGFNYGSFGLTNVPVNLTNVVGVEGGGNYSLALRRDGTMTAWGDTTYGVGAFPASLSNVVAIAGGSAHSLALRNDGTVLAWGYSAYGQTNVPMDLNNVVSIACGSLHSLALRNDGTVVAWGNNWYGQATLPDGLSNVVAIAAGEYHSLALESDGNVVAWGYNYAGQTSVPIGLTNIVAIAGGYYHSLALRNDGTLAMWGSSNAGQTGSLAGVSNVVAVACGLSHSLALGPSPTPNLQMNGATITEGNSGTTISFAVTLSEASPLSVTVQYGTSDGTATVADNDFVGTNGVMSFLPGETNKAIRVSVNGDSKVERNEFFLVNLLAVTNASLTITQSVGTIINDDLPVLFLSRSSSNLTVSWADGTGCYVLEETGNLSPPVNWTTVTNAPTVITDLSTLSVDMSAPSKFYRLMDSCETLQLLQIGHVGSQVRVSWPAWTTGWSLQSSGSPLSNGGWSPVTNTPVVIGGKKVLTVNPTSGNQFYRLIKTVDN